MLPSILKTALPLLDAIDLSDPYGLGLVLRIFRQDSTGYEEALRKHPENAKWRSDLQQSAVAKALGTRGGRRGKGGRVERAEAAESIPDAPRLYVEDLAEIIAEHLFKVIEIGDEAREAFRVGDIDANHPGLGGLLLQGPSDLPVPGTPLDPSGQPLFVPAAYRDGKPIMHAEDVEDGDDQIPWGGFSADTPKPTISNVLGLWIVRTSENADLFGVTETKEGAEMLRPTSPGQDPNLAASDSSTDDP